MANRVSLASLVQAAHAAGFRVATYSPGDGRTRYRFFRASEHPGEVDYFGSSRPVRTVSGAAAASKFIDEQRKVQRHAAQAHTAPVLTAKKPSMADVKRANVEYHRRRGESWSFFDPGNKRVFGVDKFSGPYAGPGGVFFVVSNKAGTSAKRVEASGNIEHVAVDAVGLIEYRSAAKKLAAGARKRNGASAWKVKVSGAKKPMYTGTDAKAAKEWFAAAQSATRQQHSSAYGQIATLIRDGVVIKATLGGEHLVGKHSR